MGVNGIYGLSGSGLDIESMVKVGMMSKQSEYDKMQQKYTKNEWTKAAYIDVYSKVQTFNNSTLSNYKMSNTMNAHSAESSNSEIKATANANAPIMNHTVEVGKAATNAYLIGTETLARKGDASATSTNLKDVLFANLKASGDNVTYTDDSGNTQTVSKNDVAFKFTVADDGKGGVSNSNDSVAEVAVSGSADSGTYTVNITSVAQNASLSGSTNAHPVAHVLANDDGEYSGQSLANLLFQSFNSETNEYTTAKGDTSVITDTSKTAFSFKLGDGTNTTEIKFSYADIMSGATVSDLADEINNAGLNVTASYDSSTKAFSIAHNDIGSANKISIQVSANDGENIIDNTAARFLNNLKLTDGVSGTRYTGTNFTTGMSSAIKFSGADATGTVGEDELTFSGNTATLDGITYTAKSVGETEVSVTSKTISVTYGQLANDYTFNDLASDINNLGTNAKATYDTVNDKFSFYNSNSGKDNGVSFAMADANDGGTAAANFFNALGLKQSTNGTLEDALTFSAGSTNGSAGTNANVKIDGVDYDLADNKATVNGVTYTFANATEGAKSTVSVTQDTDKIIDNVKSFIEDYNKLLSSLYELYDEKPNSSYKPLTESQKDSMKEEQITKWEEKAKAGMLYHDQTLGKLISDMRDAVSSKIEGVSGKYDTIFSIGISTTGTKGQLTLNEDKLRAALNDDPDSVYTVFARLDSTNDTYQSEGIAQRLSTVFNNGMKSIKSRSGTDSSTNDDSDLSKLMRELQTKMSNFKAMMNAFEEKLYKKYDSMETALASLGTQLNYVTSAFA